MEYTKGKLKVDRGNSFQTDVYLADSPQHRIASISTGVSVYSGATEKEGEGNLNLFLASGAMYEALKEIKLLCADSAYRQSTREQIIGGKCFKALAQARGRE